MAVNGTNGHSAETVAGVVVAVNDKGLRLDGRDGWLNYSKWAGELVPPARGERVAVTLDKAGFIRGLEPAAADAHHSPTTGRETAIIRQPCLKGSRRVLRRQARAEDGRPVRAGRADGGVGHALSELRAESARNSAGRPPAPTAVGPGELRTHPGQTVRRWGCRPPVPGMIGSPGYSTRRVYR